VERTHADVSDALGIPTRSEARLLVRQFAGAFYDGAMT
jgi:hypothetical protein